MTPSANNDSLGGVYATRSQPELCRKAFDALNEGNKLWAGSASGVVIVSKNFARNIANLMLAFV